ncbi:DUF2207 domain-containing protein [Bifidobacterium avesanii]|uniref:DUF2207 domain-containing protein n=1 Tax=Bifidobacterium avesanii TaxID=1798157 RepID=A0A7K3THC6_9BIFI|nr:DUF2207 domain-containing protein [Bifidobacterium avesanii]KAB8292677.1 hypothetical protein DSM100685_0966 [Bifidobacterium avesanii]NEG78495.1 DUF2207 domain-containing protein [Bifidobacterium avesanii]
MDGKRAISSAIRAALFTVLILSIALVSAWGARGGSSSADMTYRSLDYDVTVQPDGRFVVTQHIDMRLNKRTDADDNVRPWKQLYQQYRLGANLAAITDVSVTNAATGETYTQTDPASPSGVGDNTWNSDYARHWYIADVTGGDDDPQPYEPDTSGTSARTVEIGWNIPVTKQANSLKFDVTMTFTGAVTRHSDIASFQWEPMGPANQAPVGKVTGTVRFPDGVNAGNSWGWLHYSGTSETKRGANGELVFTAYDVRRGNHLDVVGAFDAGFAQSDSAFMRYANGSYLSALQADEASQETLWRSQQRVRARIELAMWAVPTLIGAVLCVVAMAGALRSWKRSRYHGDVGYWREPPDMSPASAATMAKLMDLKGDAKGGDRRMSATVLSLASKKALAIYPGPSSLYRGIDMSRANAVKLSGLIGDDGARAASVRETNTIVILPAALEPGAEQSLRLSPSELAALELLKAISRRIGSPVFDMRQMKLACEDWKDGYVRVGAFDSACDGEYAMLGATRSGGGAAATAAVFGMVMAVLSAIVFVGISGNLALFAVVSVPMMFVSLFAFYYRGRITITDAGQRYAGQVLGLYRYLTDFSDFTDRGTADLVLWDRYLVYATAFGIADRALVELAKAYPEVMDPDWLDDNASGSLLYWNYRSRAWRGASYGSAAGSAAGSGGMAGPLEGPSAFSGDFGSIGTQLDAGFADIGSTIQAAAPSSSSSGGSGGFGGSGGSFSGGGFGGSSGGSGGGSFGGR